MRIKKNRMFMFIVILICSGIVFSLGVLVGKVIEHTRFFIDDEEEIEVDEPISLVTYKDRKKVYGQLGWHIND